MSGDPSGADMVGELEVSGIGTLVPGGEARQSDALKQRCTEHNKRLMQVIREDEHSKWLLEATNADAALGRISPPVAWGGRDDTCLVHPRFASCQVRPDGSTRRRAVGNCSWSPTPM